MSDGRMQRYGLIGLGRMGSGVARRVLQAGAGAVVFDPDPQAVSALVREGAEAAASAADVARRLDAPRIIWLMVPAGDAVDQVLFGEDGLVPHLQAGDVVIDGGNSFYRDSVRRFEVLRERGVFFLDCGSSGGLEGARHGLCLMVGGERAGFERAEPLFKLLARPDGYRHVGPAGAGHFVKMVHNGIEYVILQALGEGFELLHQGPYTLDLAEIAHLWNQGSVIRSWLLELAAEALRADPRLENLSGYVGGGSTGNWAVEEAWKAGVPAPAMALSYAMRLRSRQTDTFSGKLVAALRRAFGGHQVHAIGESGGDQP